MNKYKYKYKFWYKYKIIIIIILRVIQGILFQSFLEIKNPYSPIFVLYLTTCINM
jgi:hypothetical protein